MKDGEKTRVTDKSFEPSARNKLKKREKRIVSLFAQGNVPLHFGKYQTDEDIENKRKELLAYNFFNHRSREELF